MFINSVVNLQNVTLFVVGRTLQTSGDATNQRVFCVRPNTGASYNATDALSMYYDYITSSSTFRTRFYGSGLGNNINDTVTFRDLVLNCYTQNAAGSLSSFLYGGTATTRNGNARTTTGQGFAVGAEFNAGAYVTGSANNFQVCEIVVYASVLTTTQRQQIESYLSWKWNTQRFLPTTQPYFGAPFNTYYGLSLSNNIFNNIITLPSQIPGLSLWLDASDPNTVQLSSLTVTQWSDKSGNNNHATQVTASNRPTYNSGQKAINLSGSSQFFNITDPNNLVSNTTFSIFFVEKRGSSASQNYILGGSVLSLNANLHMGYRTDNQFTMAFYQNDLNISVTSYNSSNEPIKFWLANYNGSQQSVNLNGTNIGSRAQTTNLVSWNNGSIGRYINATFYNGNIYEMLFFKPSLSTRQQQQIEGYLAWKWNLQSNLPVNHPTFVQPLPVTLSPIISNYNFSPNSLSNCALWLDANDISRMNISGSNISQYVDKSPNQIILSNNTLANQPILVSDSNNRFNIQFNGTSQFLVNLTIAASNLTTNDEVSVFFVHSPTNANNSLISWASLLSGSRINFHTPESSTVLKFDYVTAGAGRVELSIANYTTSGRRIDGGYKRGTDQVLRTYGSNAASKTNSFTVVPSSNLPLTLGWFYNASSYYYAGRFCELVWYSRGLSDNEINQIEGYLSWKWNLQSNLPASHPFRNFPPG